MLENLNLNFLGKKRQPKAKVDGHLQLRNSETLEHVMFAGIVRLLNSYWFGSHTRLQNQETFCFSRQPFYMYVNDITFWNSYQGGGSEEGMQKLAQYVFRWKGMSSHQMLHKNQIDLFLVGSLLLVKRPSVWLFVVRWQNSHGTDPVLTELVILINLTVLTIRILPLLPKCPKIKKDCDRVSFLHFIWPKW